MAAIVLTVSVFGNAVASVKSTVTELTTPTYFKIEDIQIDGPDAVGKIAEYRMTADGIRYIEDTLCIDFEGPDSASHERNPVHILFKDGMVGRKTAKAVKIGKSYSVRFIVEKVKGREFVGTYISGLPMK